jgi:hypothetical protein
VTTSESTIDPAKLIDKEVPEIVTEALAEAEILASLADPRLNLTAEGLHAHALANLHLICEPARAQFDRYVEELAKLARESIAASTSPAQYRRRWRRPSPATDLLKQADAAKTEWRNAVRENGVLPLLRTLINERMVPLLWSSMAVREAPGLDRLRDSAFIVETASTNRFLDAVGQIHSGAVGIAGARGIGKTTVIEFYLARARRQVTITVPAPVQYDAREFVLHLYAEMCHEVIDRFGPSKITGYHVGLLSQAVRWLVLTMLGLLASTVAAMIAVGPNVVLRHLDHIGEHIPAPWLPLWPAGALALATLISLFWTLSWTLVDLANVRFLRRLLAWLVLGPETPLRASNLVDTAKRRLARIRFLQTRTIGWSGKVIMPSTEVGLSKSTQRAEQPLTYPEIVHELRGFIRSIVAEMAGHPGVIVAVDELDKIEDAEQAQRFINEIKGIFGVDGAQFLVSVSEDALASFERRGVSVRDAFDSAFDEIVRIEPLNLADACTLLNSRVIGLSDLFSCLAHCMAGGLARDIIRTARSMRLVVGRYGDGIGSVAIGLVEADIASKVHAFQQAAGKLGAERDTTDFIRTLRGLRAEPATLLGALAALRPEGAEQLQWQAATYAYHCATVLQVFDDRLTKVLFDERRDILETLASAKQELGTHPQLAWLMLDEFREAWGLPTAPTA